MKICAYQICYSEETIQSVPSGFLILDNVQNERPDWRELWPIRNFLSTNTLAEDTLYGFLSPRFSEKTGLTFEAIRSFIESNYSNHDVVSFSPFWDLMCLFKNVFEQVEIIDGFGKLVFTGNHVQQIDVRQFGSGIFIVLKDKNLPLKLILP
jgi:hypothetical protein